MKKVMIVASMALALAACATVTKQMVPVSGSRADGTVKLAFTYGMFEKVAIDYPAANASAAQRCVAWGYKSAEPFGAAQTICQASGEYGCTQTLVTMEYQCLGGNTPN